MIAAAEGAGEGPRGWVSAREKGRGWRSQGLVFFGLRGWRLWRTLIVPAIFPFWVTGAVTAAGGAWNASIVAEVASWGKDKLVASGLGAYIAQVTEQDHKPALYFAVVVDVDLRRRHRPLPLAAALRPGGTQVHADLKRCAPSAR